MSVYFKVKMNNPCLLREGPVLPGGRGELQVVITWVPSEQTVGKTWLKRLPSRNFVGSR